MFKHLFKREKKLLGLPIKEWFVLKFGLIIYAVLALWDITKSSIWFDEAFGMYLIRFDFWDVAKYTASDVHPPLYYWLLKLWTMLFGTNELAIRSMSVLFGVIAIIFGYLLIRKLFSKNAASLSLLFMVLSPMLVRYGQEARMYTLVTAIALAATFVLTYAVNTKKRLPWVIYGVLVSLGMWVHYFSAIIWISHWIWRADLVRRIAKKGRFIKEYFSKEWLLAHFVAVGLFLPWIPFFVSQLFTVQAFGFWIPPVMPGTLVNFMTNVVYYQDMGQVTGWMALAFWVLIITMAVLAVRVYSSMNDKLRQSYGLIMTLAFVPMILLFLLSMPPLRSSFIDRYLIASTLGIALFIGVTLSFGIKYLRPKIIALLATVVVVMMGVGTANVWSFGNYNKNSHASNGTRQIIEAVHDKSIGDEKIIAATPWLFYEAVYYETTDHPVLYLDEKEYLFGSLVMLKENDMYKIKDVEKFEKENDTFWYVGYSTEGVLNAPYPGWQAIQEVVVNDSVSGGPAYKAIQYKKSVN